MNFRSLTISLAVSGRLAETCQRIGSRESTRSDAHPEWAGASLAGISASSAAGDEAAADGVELPLPPGDFFSMETLNPLLAMAAGRRNDGLDLRREQLALVLCWCFSA